jgi:small redox-active disulfide protein 2
MEIKVLGPGCANCEKAYQVVCNAVASIGADAHVSKVTDMMEIAAFGVVGTPAIAVDGEVKLAGRIPRETDVLAWIRP